MHSYAPNFEESEGANWFGPVPLSVHLPPNTSPQNFFLIYIWILCTCIKKSPALAPPPPPRLPPPPPSPRKKIFCTILNLDSYM